MCTGTRLPGFWGALVSGQLLGRVRVLPPELLHLLLVGAGALHTLLGASEQGDGAAATGQLQLQWQPGSRDTLSVAVVALLGATAASAQQGGGGSAPPFCASFAAGLAIRMAFYDVTSPRGGTNVVGEALTRLFGMAAHGLHAFAGVEILGSDAVAVRCGDGVGTCGGGLVRSGVAWLAVNELGVSWLSPPNGFDIPPDKLVALLLACAIKATLLALPTLAAAQWGLRAAQAIRGINAIKAANGQASPAAASTDHPGPPATPTAASGPGAQAAAARPSAAAAARLPMLQEQLWLSAAMLACTLRLLAFVLAYELNGVHSSPNPLRH